MKNSIFSQSSNLPAQYEQSQNKKTIQTATIPSTSSTKKPRVQDITFAELQNALSKASNLMQLSELLKIQTETIHLALARLIKNYHEIEIEYVNICKTNSRLVEIAKQSSVTLQKNSMLKRLSALNEKIIEIQSVPGMENIDVQNLTIERFLEPTGSINEREIIQEIILGKSYHIICCQYLVTRDFINHLLKHFIFQKDKTTVNFSNLRQRVQNFMITECLDALLQKENITIHDIIEKFIAEELYLLYTKTKTNSKIITNEEPTISWSTNKNAMDILDLIIASIKLETPEEIRQKYNLSLRYIKYMLQNYSYKNHISEKIILKDFQEKIYNFKNIYINSHYPKHNSQPTEEKLTKEIAEQFLSQELIFTGTQNIQKVTRKKRKKAPDISAAQHRINTKVTKLSEFTQDDVNNEEINNVIISSDFHSLLTEQNYEQDIENDFSELQNPDFNFTHPALMFNTNEAVSSFEKIEENLDTISRIL